MNASPAQLFTWGLIIAGVVIALSLALGIPDSTGQAFVAYKPWAFPLLCAVGLILTGIFVLSVKTRDNPMQDDKPNAYSYRTSIGTLAIMLLFAASFEILGFVVSSFIAMALLSVFAGARNLIQTFVFAGLLPSFLYVLMVYIMGVSLPAGVIF